MIQDPVVPDQVRTLYRQTPVVLVANCLNTAIVSAVLWRTAERRLLIGWGALVVLVSVVRVCVYVSYRRAAPEGDAARWGWRFVWGSAASGVAWGGASALLLGGADPLGQLLIIFIAGGMCTAAAGALASHLPAFVAFALPTLLALMASLAAFTDPIHQIMAAVIAIYGAGLFMVARVNHRAVSEAFALRFENTELLSALMQTQRRLEDNNRTLEERVAERSEELRRQSEALRESQRLEAVGRLAGGIAHDFNNWLTVLLANISELAARRGIDAATRSSLGEMRDAASKAADLVRQLLTFSRRQRMSPETLDLNETVSNLQRLLGRLLGGSVQLEVSPWREPIPVHVDPTQIEQVVVNLITNARDAMAGDGTVRVDTRSVEIGEDEDGLGAGQYAVLTVTDSGIGMDQETRQRIFEPFFTTKEVGKGTGLGLATAYAIVEQSGGRIRVRSEPARGSCFEVYLPLADTPLGVRATGTRPPPARSGLREVVRGARGWTLLLVEDEPTVRSVTRRILSQAGHDVLAAGSAEEGLKLAAEHPGPIDMLVTDVMMAGMDGPTLAERLQRLRPELRILFISGYSKDLAVPEDNPMGGVSFLAKPFTYEALVAKVIELMASPMVGASREARDVR